MVFCSVVNKQTNKQQINKQQQQQQQQRTKLLQRQD